MSRGVSRKPRQLTASCAVYRIDQYIPDALYEPYETVRDTLLTWLVRLGMLGRGARSPLTPSDAPHTADARTKFQAASDEAGRVREDLRKTDEALEQLDGIFGPQGEWKKLENTCIDKEQGGQVGCEDCASSAWPDNGRHLADTRIPSASLEVPRSAASRTARAVISGESCAQDTQGETVLIS